MKLVLALVLLSGLIALSYAAQACTAGNCKGAVYKYYTDNKCSNVDTITPYRTIIDNAGEGGKCQVGTVAWGSFAFSSFKTSCGARLTIRAWGSDDCSGTTGTYISSTTGKCFQISSNRWAKVQCAGAASFFLSTGVVLLAVFALLMM